MNSNAKSDLGQDGITGPAEDRLLVDIFGGRRALMLLAVLITVMVYIIYFDFLTFKQLFIYHFSDIGSDAHLQFWPNFQAIHEHFAAYGLPLWSFNHGLGQNVFLEIINNPFNWLPVLLGGGGLAYSLGYMQALQIVVAGLFFYLYLKELGVRPYSAICGALLYAFSGHMVLRGGWYHYAAEVALLAAVLYALELCLKGKQRWAFPVAAGLFLFVRGPFHFYAYSVLLVFYVTVRFALGPGRAREYPVYLGRTLLQWLQGALLAAVMLLPALARIMANPRAGNALDRARALFDRGFFEFNSPLLLQSTLYRFFSSDLMGTGTEYSGAMNYLEAPLFYSGLVCLVAAPLFFYSLAGRKVRLVYAAVVGAALVYLLMPFPRMLLNAFSTSSYKTASFWITVMLIIFAVKGLDYLQLKTNALKPLPYFGLAGGLLVLAYLGAYLFGGSLLSPLVLNLAALFLLLHIVALWLVNRDSLQHQARLALLGLIVLELTLFSYITVNQRNTLGPEHLAGGFDYYDSSYEAVQQIKGFDESDFYRLEKKGYYSVFVADQLMQGYYGTSSYHSFNNGYYLLFLDEMEIPLWHDTFVNYIIGFGERFLLDTLVGVKYLLIKDEADWFYGYDYLETVDDVHIMQNSLHLPLGFAYDHYIDDAALMALEPWARDLVLLKACVLEPGSAGPGGLTEYSPDLEKELFADIESNTDRYFEIYSQRVLALREQPFVVEQFEQSRIKGRVELEEAMMLFFSIPFDRGWQVRVNGERRSLEQVNLGFSGIYLEGGSHEIELYYRPPLMMVGLGLSLLGLLWLGFGILREKALRRSGPGDIEGVKPAVEENQGEG